MSRDRIKTALNKIIAKALKPVDYYALYPARIAAQSLDSLSVDLVPDDTRIPHVRNVPLRLGIPGTTCKVAIGSRVHLGFDAGNPLRPFAAIFESATVISITLPDGLQPIARVGDAAGPFAIIGPGNLKVLG